MKFFGLKSFTNSIATCRVPNAYPRNIFVLQQYSSALALIALKCLEPESEQPIQRLGYMKIAKNRKWK